MQGCGTPGGPPHWRPDFHCELKDMPSGTRIRRFPFESKKGANHRKARFSSDAA
jgi:hypothetical protein